MLSPGAAYAFAPPGSSCLGGPVAPGDGGQSPSASERVLLTPVPTGPWSTTDALRPFQPQWRVRECGRWVAWGEGEVHIRLGDSGWSFGHIHRCGSPWACPSCAHVISMERASEVAHAVAWWRAQDATAEADVVLLTLTVRHTFMDDLRTLRQGVSQAWRVVEQSRMWRAMREVCGVSHHIRCQEVTHGENGWHPHLHILLFCTRPELALTWAQQLSDCWRYQVQKQLGEQCLPSKRRACDMRACDDETYISRMGLEVGAPGAKHAQDGHMTAMQLAAELANASGQRKAYLGALWGEYVVAMRGAHQLQWSRGLRAALGVAESDGQIASRPEHPERAILAEIPAETWRDMARDQGLAPIAALGCKMHGLPERDQLAALKAHFEASAGCSARWRVIGGRMRLRWLC